MRVVHDWLVGHDAKKYDSTLNGKADAISRWPDYKSPPSPSIPILSRPTFPPLLSAPHSSHPSLPPYLIVAIFLREGHFEYQVCPQGPTNAPAMFQHFMNDILREYLDLIAVGIPDDVIIFSNSLADHIPHVKSILEVLRQHRL